MVDVQAGQAGQAGQAAAPRGRFLQTRLRRFLKESPGLTTFLSWKSLTGTVEDAFFGHGRC